MFSALTLEHVLNPQNVGELKAATHTGSDGIPGEGPYVVIHLRIEGGTIREATYETYGCPAAIGSASLVTRIVANMTVEGAMKIEPHDLDILLGGLPEGKGHCPQMAVNALRNAFKEK